MRRLAGDRDAADRFGKQVARLVEEHAAGVGEPEAPLFANEQLGPNFLLELAHVHAERRRRDVEMGRRLAQILAFGNGDEEVEPAKVHL